MILTLPDVLSAAELALVRDGLRQASWDDGRETAGAQASQVKRNQQLPEDSDALAQVRHTVMAALNRHALFFSAALPLRVLPPFVNRHAGELNAYGWHVDSAMRRAPDGGHVRADVSATLFLSDPDTYEGGELTVQDTFGTHAVKLAAGSLVLYPSSSVHAVAPVTQGERLACFLFLQSMVRDPSRRRLLFDMDMALLSLREQVGESPAVVTLTGTYHNLLRQWASD